MGVTGLEVAPSRVWRNTWHRLKPREVESYRLLVENAGLRIIGLHSLFYDQPGLGLFGDTETLVHTMDFMEHLSKLCRDLGGKTLIYGGGRKRGGVPLEEAYARSEAFFYELIPRIEQHNTIFCFEPLAVKDSDFINSTYDSIRLVKAVNHSSLKVQLDAKALVENNELTQAVFEAAAPYLAHVHANEPDFGVLGASGTIDHRSIGSFLRGIGYQQYVSIEQRMIGASFPLVALERSVNTLKECYQ